MMNDFNSAQPSNNRVPLVQLPNITPSFPPSLTEIYFVDDQQFEQKPQATLLVLSQSVCLCCERVWTAISLIKKAIPNPRSHETIK